MANPLEVMDVAPDFTLPSSATERWKLSDVLTGKHAVLAFYVLDFTSA